MAHLSIFYQKKKLYGVSQELDTPYMTYWLGKKQTTLHLSTLFKMTNAAFNAKFRIVDNNSDRENAPERNLIIDISTREALKMAKWLETMAVNATQENTTIRIYKNKSEYTEVDGFSIWGGMWGNSGRIQPLNPKPASQRTIDVKANQSELPSDIPF
tara:strand:- start:2 stop:472 length:471 start_codon:yes stop_codon:yes gene_type:complete